MIEIVTVVVIIGLLVGLSVVGTNAIRTRGETQLRDQLMLQIHNDATAAARMGSSRGVTLADTLPPSLFAAPVPDGAVRYAADASWFEVSYDGLCRRATTGEQASFEGCDYFEPSPDGPAPGGTVPDPPRNVAGTAVAQTIEVSFEPPLNDGGSPITDYTATAGGAGYTCSTAPPSLSCTIADVAPGGPYAVEVTATNETGTSTPGVAPAAVNIMYPTLVAGPPPDSLGQMEWAEDDLAWELTSGVQQPVWGEPRINAHPETAYRMSADVRRTTDEPDHSFYLGLVTRDIDGHPIVATNHMHVPASHTTLAQPLTPGDTVVYLTDLSDWQAATTVDGRKSLMFWTYRDSFGNEYPVGTYTRHRRSDAWTDADRVNVDAGTIELREPWTNAGFAGVATDHVWPAGTPLSQGGSGNSYKYVAASNEDVTGEWVRHEGTFGGVDYSGSNVQNMLPPGTVSLSVLVLANRGESGPTRTMQLREVTIEPADGGS